MPVQLKAALSAAVHALVALIVSVLVARGIDMPAGWSAVLESAILGVVIGLYVALTHWLASRPGVSIWAKAARWLSVILTVGFGPLIPADLDVRTGTRDGVHRV